MATGKQEGSLGKQEGAIWGRRRSEGGGSWGGGVHCGYRAPSGKAGEEGIRMTRSLSHR